MRRLRDLFTPTADGEWIGEAPAITEAAASVDLDEDTRGAHTREDTP